MDAVNKMDKEAFIKRLVALHMQKGVSARDMSLSLGQSAGYINNIENGVNLPSMAAFFLICEYFGVTPKEFFDIEDSNPFKLNELIAAARGLSDDKLDVLIAVAKELCR